jgi:chemotaxis protein MotB
MRRLLLLSILSVCGCVSQGKYDDLKQRYDAAQDQLGQRQARIGSLGASLSDARTEIDQRKQENRKAREQLALLEDERVRLEQEQRGLVQQLMDVLSERQRLKASSEQLKAALLELGKRKAEADRRVAEFKTLIARFKDLIDAGTLKVALVEGRMVLQLPSDVLFDSGSAKLSKTGKAAIVEVASVLKEIPDRRYQVEGHTDDVPIHNLAFASNWELAAARGLVVLRAMVDGGVEVRRMSAASYGEFHPAAANDSEPGRALNRRIEIILVPDLAMLPGYEELQQIVHAP